MIMVTKEGQKIK